jgi:hypoxanthine phosphoribosyltransferase
VAALGHQITTEYAGKDLLLLGVLKGSCIFLGDLVRNIRLPLHLDFVMAASYGNATSSSGTVRLVYDPETLLAGRSIILVEDIVDSGRTLSLLLRHLRARSPESLEICALFDKLHAGELERQPRFVGFAAPNEFLVGYGLDHAEDFRQLPFVASLV